MLLACVQEVLEEMKKFRDALKKYYNSKDQSCISFERNFRSQHLQIQVWPCISKTLSILYYTSNMLCILIHVHM